MRLNHEALFGEGRRDAGFSVCSHWKKTRSITVHFSFLFIPVQSCYAKPSSCTECAHCAERHQQIECSRMFLTHIYFEWRGVCVRARACACVRVYVPSVLRFSFMSLVLIEPKGKYTSRMHVHSLFKWGSCFLFAYHIQKCTQNSSQSHPEGEGEMKIHDGGEGRLDLRHSCQVVMQIMFRNMAIKVNPSCGGIHFKIP